ncbi:MAG: phage tail protein [Candidatus Devosia symbiotica]|nr:phage tail protein [Candidatus Devosia symbiotica]
MTEMAQADGPLTGETMALVFDGAAARLGAERLLDAQSARRETLEFALPPARLALEPGSLVAIAGLAESPFEISDIRDGQTRRITLCGIVEPASR